MKKTILGAIVGGILIFIWQFLSWTVLDLHRPANEYTPRQAEILSYLSSQLPEEGGYFLPNLPKNASMEDQEKYMQECAGKPWAQVFYHKSMDASMGMNMLINLIVNIIMVWLFCWILSGFNINSFSKTFLAALFTGLIVFIHGHYATHIWYETFDTWAHLTDYIVSWGLVGIWLGWLWNRKRSEA